MSISELTGGNVPIKLWTPVEEVESSALDQLRNVAKLPWVFKHVAVMPDVHYGVGATVGSVIAMKNALAPAAVGVDIGCGMGAVRTNLRASDLPDDLKAIRIAIEQAIPVGFNAHEKPNAWGHRDSTTGRKAQDLFKRFGALHDGVQKLEGKARKQCGTLGGGNHFIELCLDTPAEGPCKGTTWVGSGTGGYAFVPCGSSCWACNGTGKPESHVWLMLHSGSRNIGKELAEIHINIARKLIHNEHLPDRDLAVFLSNTPEMTAYRHDLMWAQEYAMLNRMAMMQLYKNVLTGFFPQVSFDEPIMCHHNYVSEETHFGEDVIVTRKGAISAKSGQMGIIPGSMGTKSYIVEGRGNEESFHSASHGAGRRMSRGKAKKTYNLEDFASQTQGVECRKDQGVLDEIPGAYKDIDRVMENQKELVTVKAVLKQVLCVKG